MSNKSIEYSIKRKILYDYFSKGLSSANLILDKYSKFSLILTFFFLVATLVDLALWVKFKSVIFQIIYLTTNLLSLFFAIFAVFLSGKYIKKEYPNYSPLFKKKSLIHFNDDVLNAIRRERVYKFIEGNNLLDLDEMLDYSDYFLQLHIETKATKWFPISLAGIVFFPVYGEYIGFIYSTASDLTTSIDKIALSIMIAFGLLIFVFIATMTLRILLLSKSDVYKRLADTLRISKSIYYP